MKREKWHLPTKSTIQCKSRAIFDVLMDPANGIFDNKGYRINQGKSTLR